MGRERKAKEQEEGETKKENFIVFLSIFVFAIQDMINNNLRLYIFEVF